MSCQHRVGCIASYHVQLTLGSVDTIDNTCLRMTKSQKARDHHKLLNIALLKLLSITLSEKMKYKKPHGGSYLIDTHG